MPVGGYLGGLIPGGWRVIPVLYAAILLATAALVGFVCPKVDRKPSRGRSLTELLAPLQFVQVWRFSLYYVVVFGAYVALSAWLPNYYTRAYGVELRTAAVDGALHLPGQPAPPVRRLALRSLWPAPRHLRRLYRAPGGDASALFAEANPRPRRRRLYGAFGGDRRWHGHRQRIGLQVRAELLSEGCGSGRRIGGDAGVLGGFVLPPLFGAIGRWSGSPQTAFFVHFALTAGSLLWLHGAVRRIKRAEKTVLGSRAMAKVASAS